MTGGPDRPESNAEPSLLVASRGTAAAFSLDGTRRWEVALPPESRVVRVTPQRLFVADEKRLHAVDVPSGGVGWTFEIDEETVLGSVSASGERVYLVAARYPTSSERFDETFDRLYALDAATGAVVWRWDDLPGSGERQWSLGATADTVYVTWEHGKLLAYARDGTKRWEVLLGGDAYGVGTIRDDVLYVDFVGGVAAHSAETGRSLWRTREVDHVLAVDERRVYAVEGDRPVQYVALDAATGRAVWRRSPADHAYLVGGAVAGGAFYVAVPLPSREARLYGLDAATGCPVGYLAVQAETVTPPVAADSRVFFGASGDGVYSVAGASVDG